VYGWLGPADIPQRLADSLIGALVALEFDDQEPGLRLVNRQDGDPPDISRVLVPRLGIVGRACSPKLEFTRDAYWYGASRPVSQNRAVIAIAE